MSAASRLARLIGHSKRRAPAAEPDDGSLTHIDLHKLNQIVALLNERSQPNINQLSVLTKNIDILALNVKSLGYALAREMGKTLSLPRDTAARHVPLGCKLSTQADMESDWAAHWCKELKAPIFYHRKLWELAYLLQVLHNHALLRPGVRGLGFGCGTEPLASYFAGRGMTALISDLAADDARSTDWNASNQHAASLQQAFHPHLVDRERFDRNVSFRPVDMNAVPDDLTGFDFCWSVCALEHLGSIEQGLAFIERSIATLRPGGVAIHTTEYNINPDGPTIDNWMTVLFQRRHFEDLARRLSAQGHTLAALDLDPGDKPLDTFIDLPPWHDGTLEHVSRGLGQPSHLKVGIDGFVSTCIGLQVTKAA